MPKTANPARPSTLTRRTVLGGAAASVTSAAGLAALTACGTDDDTTTAGGSGGTLTVGFDNEPNNLDAALSAQISSDRNLLNLFYDALIRQQRDGSFSPALAEKWESSGSTVTFTLREGVVFHDGTPLDADAVVFNLRRVLDPATKSTKAGALKKVSAVDAVDPRTVRVTLKAPDPLLLVHLAHEAGMIASPTAVKAAGADYGRKPVGTGPFVFDEWRSKVQLTARRHDKYWAKAADGSALPKLGKVVVRFVTDPKVLRAEIATGGVQLLRVLPPEEYEQLKSEKKVTIEDVGVRRSYYVTLNVTRPPFNNPAVRKAFAAAIDRAGVGKAAAGSEFDIAPSFATRKDWFYDGDLQPTPLDLAAAKRTLADSGVGAVPVAITILARRRAPDPTIAELLQAQVTAAGFNAKVEVLESQTQLDRMRQKDFDASVLVIDIPRLDPSLSFDPYFQSKGPNNWSGLVDPTLDGLLDKGAATADRAARKPLYVDVQRRVLEQNYWVFLHQPLSPLIRSSRLSGVVLDVDGQWRLGEATVS